MHPTIVFADETGSTPPATRPASSELELPWSPEHRSERTRNVVSRFLAFVEAAPISDEAKTAIEQAWNARPATDAPEEPISMAEAGDFLMAGLAIYSEPFNDALEALEFAEYELADPILKQLAESENKWVAFNARALLSRSLVEQDLLEEAQTRLESLSGQAEQLARYTFLLPEVEFLLGYTQLLNLHYEEATVNLRGFLKHWPNAPESLRLPAEQMLQELEAREPDGLGDVSDLMAYAGRRLTTGSADTNVRSSQQRAIDLLDSLIEEAEQQEQQQQQQSQGGGQGGQQGQKNQQPQGQQQGGQRQAGGAQGNQQSGSPAQESRIVGGEGGIGELHEAPRAKPGEVWGKMRPEDREKVLQSLRESFPSRYRQLVEQYYRQLAKEQ